MVACVAVIGKDVSTHCSCIYRLQLLTYKCPTIQPWKFNCLTNSGAYVLQNSPKYIKCADEASALQFHYKVHTSIDIIEEKLSVGNKTAVDTRDLYLGLLFATEEYKMYVNKYDTMENRNTKNI